MDYHLAGVPILQVKEESVDVDIAKVVLNRSRAHVDRARHFPLPPSISQQHHFRRSASTDTESTICSSQADTGTDDDAAPSPIAVTYPSSHHTHRDRADVSNLRSKKSKSATGTMRRSKREPIPHPPSRHRREQTPISTSSSLPADLAPISLGTSSRPPRGENAQGLRRTYALSKEEFRLASKDFAGTSSLRARPASAKADLGRKGTSADGRSKPSSSSDSNLTRKPRSSSSHTVSASRPASRSSSSRKDHGKEHR